MLQVRISDSKIVFKVGADMAKRISFWQTSMDKRVFEEQLASGYLKEKLGEETLEVILEAFEKNGKPLPYYGASGGGYNYMFWVDGDKCNLEVKNPLAREALHFQEKMETWDGEFNGDTELLYEIALKEYENLKKSNSWVREQALTDKYVYHFGPCGLGVSIQVENTKTGEIFDISNYDNW